MKEMEKRKKRMREGYRKHTGEKQNVGKERKRKIDKKKKKRKCVEKKEVKENTRER